MTRSRFVDGLLLLDARETRARLAEALAAARAHPAYVEQPESRLASAVGQVEVALLFAARDAVKRIDEAMQAAARRSEPGVYGPDEMPF